MLGCPAIAALVIASNQTYCTTRWDAAVSSGLVFIQFILLCLTLGVVSVQCNK